MANETIHTERFSDCNPHDNVSCLIHEGIPPLMTGRDLAIADIFDVRDEKLFSAMCNWSNHCLHHLLPSEHDTGHDLRHRGHSYQLVCYNFSSTRRCFVIRMLYDSL